MKIENLIFHITGISYDVVLRNYIKLIEYRCYTCIRPYILKMVITIDLDEEFMDYKNKLVSKIGRW